MNTNEIKNQFKLLTGYSPNKTLTENVNIILVNEQLRDTATSVAQTFKDILSSEKGLFQTFKSEIPAFSKFKNADELIKGLETVGKDGAVLTNAEVVSIAKDLSKTAPEIATKLKGMIGKSDGFFEIAKKVYPNGAVMGADAKSLKMAQDYYKQFGIEAKEVERMLQDSAQQGKGSKTVKAFEKGGKTGESGKAFEGGSKAAEQSSKTTALAKESYIKRFKDKFKEYYNSGKGKLSSLKKKQWFQKGFLKYNKSLGKFVISKRKMLAWAAVAGVTYFAMKDWLNQNGLVEDTNQTDDGGGNGGGGNGGGNGGGGNGGGKTTYSNCTDYPYKKGCQSTVVSEIQGCLGLSADGKFGPKTEKALTDKGYGTEITKEVYDKIKVNCGSSSSTTTTTTINPATNFELTNIDAENASNLFK